MTGPEDFDLTGHFRKMALSLFVAYKALSINETPVACILVDSKTQEVVSIGYNDTNRSLNGTRHAEFIAIDDYIARCRHEEGTRGAEKAVSSSSSPDFSALTLYVTVEPCIMCASALQQMGIKNVVYGCGNDRFGGNGTVLSIHLGQYKIFPGIMRTEAVQLLRNFYIQENESAPDPKIKKNKDLENKAYPQMDYRKYMSEDEFCAFYGAERYKSVAAPAAHDGDGAARADADGVEITPILGHGYSVRDLITVEDVLGLPGLDAMYHREADQSLTAERVKADLERFSHMFYPIGASGRVDFEQKIRVYGMGAQNGVSSAELPPHEHDGPEEEAAKKRKVSIT